MSAGLVWLATFLLLPLAGLPLLSHVAFRQLPLTSRAILAGGAGAVLVSFCMTAFALLGAPWSLAAVLLAAALLSWILRRTIRDAPPPPLRRGSRGAAVLVASVLAAAAVGAALLATAAGAASSPDLIFFWGPKAQQYALARTVDARFLAEPLLRYMHPYYPPLVTNLDAWASMAAGRMVWTAATLVFPLLLAALALALPGVLRTSLPKSAAASASALVVCALAYFGIEADIGGNGEMPLLFFESLAAALLLSPVCAGAGGQLLAGILLAGAACAKVEGLPFVLCAVILFFWARPGARPVRAVLLRLFFPTVISLALWFTFGATRHLFRGYAEGGRFLDVHPEHAGIVLRAVASTLASTGYGLPYLIPLACLMLAAARLTRRAAIPLGAAAGLIGFFFFTYLHRSEDPSLWISWSAARVFSPLAMLFTLAATCARDSDAASEQRTAAASRH
ncbi:MAG: hypothetical protein ABI968_03370 [Acidobacteriota bacterium]